MRLFQGATYPFIENRRLAYALSATAVAAGIAAMIFNVFSIGSWLKYGVDFEGGSLMQVQFQQPVDIADVRAALRPAGTVDVQRFGSAVENEYSIRAPLAADASITEVAEELQSLLRAGLGNVEFEVRDTELVGAKVGQELQSKALMAVLLSMVMTLLYLAMRFELRFGLAAVVATAHDILITLGFLAAFRVEIALPTVAAILTIVGYSLNDTIVVFDRIRENMHMKGARKRDQIALVNQAINETLPRTILTSGTTLVVLFSLLLLGGAVIRDFTIVLILGVVVGTYSSIFVASPALIEIQKRWGVGKTGDTSKKERPQPATV